MVFGQISPDIDLRGKVDLPCLLRYVTLRYSTDFARIG